MKKTLFTFTISILAVSLMAGGIVTNTNQSASFIRNPAQDATIGVTGTYYNPAGLTQMRDGFHISLSNQFVTQTRTITSTFPGMNRNEFIGTVEAPLFPSAYVAYKKNKFAISFGFNPIGGGGSAAYENGLPSFEMPIASLPMLLNAGGIPTSQYSFETSFEGNSVFYGLQGNLSYQLSDVISVSLGARYVMIDNNYKGYLRNIQINPVFQPLGFSGGMVKAPTFFGAMSELFNGLAGVAGSLQPFIDNNLGGLTLAQAQGLGILTAEQVAGIAGGFALINPAVDPMQLNIAQIQGAYAQATPTFQQNSAMMASNAAATQDMEVDASQSGTGIVPVIGLNLNFDWINIGIKYEHQATIKVKNSTKVDDVGLYPDGLEVPSDIPAMLSIGTYLNFSERVGVSAGYHTYFDKTAMYGKRNEQGEFVNNENFIDNNLWEFAVGMDYRPLDKWEFSFGMLFTETGVSKAYQTDLSHSLSTWSLGGGLLFKATENIGLNLGAMRTFYRPDVKGFVNPVGISYSETYARKAMVFAVGLDFRF